jgi:purine-binding chemotaxis protein CheW
MTSRSDARSFIVFTVAGTAYALPSQQVAHVEMIQDVTAVPNAAHFLDGVVFSRGQVVPALNLRARFGFEKAPYDVATRLLVVSAADGRQVGLVADSAREFTTIDASMIQPPAAALSGSTTRYLDGVANVAGRLILLVDLPAILNDDDPVVAQPRGPSWQPEN